MIKLRNQFIGFIYRRLLKQILFLFDPERVHDRMIVAGRLLGSNSLTRGVIGLMFNYQNSKLEQIIAGVKFKNPVGLAAGFDKEAMLPKILPAVGFGFEEVGSITALAFDGNERPWIWRLPEARSLRINYGLKNSGAQNIHQRLMGRTFNFALGISIAKTNSEKTSHVETGIEDYFTSYQIFQDTGDYFTINISCPNTCEPAPIFADPKNLDLLLAKLFSIPKTKPVFIKLSPDLQAEQLEGILQLGNKYPVDGFICTNLTKVNKFNHPGKGGFSGKAVVDLSNQMLARVYKYYGGRKIIIGCGGIFSATDAYKKIKLGASLVQLITGMIFQGPQLISEINQGLVELLEKEGNNNISQAVGVDNK
ncbi:MAG: quinone-dependent dihydroorotate dehydrogenase [Patescibacteria group bacterium]